MSQVHNESRNQVRDYDTITVTPCTPHIGAEIGNIDLTQPLSNRQVQEVHDAIIAHSVIFFRNQKIDFASHERLVRYFGEPHVHVGGKGTASKSVPGYPGIRHQYFDASSKRVSGEEWHSDQSCAEIPPMYSVLYQEIIPPDGGGDTMFASAYKAYEELSPSMKTYLEGKTATHDGARVFDKNADVYPTAVHPVVIRHGKRPQGTVRQPRIHESHQRIAADGKSRRAGIPLRPHRAAALEHTLPLDAAFDRLLGQSLHPALCDLGLLAERPLGLPHVRQRHRAPGGLAAGPQRRKLRRHDIGISHLPREQMLPAREAGHAADEVGRQRGVVIGQVAADQFNDQRRL
jgi:hypothetical protein